MILLDVNVLVEAGHRDAARHAESAGWLHRVLGEDRPVGLADAVLVGAVRVLTHRKVFADPATPSAAWAFVETVREAPAAQAVGPTAATWRTFGSVLSTDEGLRGNLVPDAWLAALAIGQGAALATRDRGFARFPGLSLVTPG